MSGNSSAAISKLATGKMNSEETLVAGFISAWPNQLHFFFDLSFFPFGSPGNLVLVMVRIPL
jgi:hypothetical protein